VIAPALLTFNPVLVTVVTYVTVPVLLATAREPGLKALDADTVVTPDVDDVCVIVVPVTLSV
jgi:hypothetical protein